MVLIWENPPPRRHALTSERREILEALKTRPGTWARIGENVKSHEFNTLEQYGCEVIRRRVSGGIAALIYARYVGENGEYIGDEPAEDEIDEENAEDVGLESEEDAYDNSDEEESDDDDDEEEDEADEDEGDASEFVNHIAGQTVGGGL